MHFLSALRMYHYECIQTDVFRSDSVLNNFYLRGPSLVENG